MDNPHAEVEIKPQVKPRGSVAKGEDPKPSHQLNRLGRHCVHGIYKRTLRAPTKEKALDLTAVGIGGKNTQEEDQIRI